MPASDIELVVLLPRLRRYAHALTGSLDDADELVQSGLLRALERPDQQPSGPRLDVWLFRIIKSVWLNNRRAERVREAAPISDAVEAVGTDGVRAAECKVELAEVWKAFGRLPPEQREVMVLVCVEGYSYGDAADLLNVPIGTVMSRLARGRAALTRFVSAEDGNVTPFRTRSPNG
jgi:RNA polymerase sigma-70 factor, ECF subfamily